jgi:hypothetical protein
MKEEIIKKEEINGEVYVCLKDLYKFLEQAENGSEDLVGELQFAICENRYLFDEEEEGE